MKKIVFLLLFLIGFFGVKAQVMSAKLQTIVVKSANLRCWECKERLDKYLTKENDASFEHAIIEMKFDLLKGELKIKFYPDRASIEDIKAAINNAGFDADADKAEEEAYKKLPTACKRAEDGGGPKKGAPCHMDPNR